MLSFSIRSFCSLLILTFFSLFLSSLLLPQNANADITTGLIGHWAFDNTLNDSASTNHGTFNGSPSYQTGKIGQALSFDGVDDCVTVPDSSLWDFAGKDATISLWMRGDSDGSGTDIFLDHFSGGTPGTGWSFQLNNSNYTFFEHRGTENLFINNTSQNWRDDQWHHLVGVVRDASTSDTGEFYIDGQLYGTDTFSGLIDNNQDLGIGGTQSCSSNFQGTIDDVRIYSRALTQADITELYDYTGADTEAPTTPANFVASSVSQSQINLSWSASTDNVDVTDYRIYRCQGLSCTPTLFTSIGNTTSYSDTGLQSNTTYRYQVRAVDAAGNESGLSSIASATTQSAALPIYSVLKTGTVPTIDGNLSEYASANTIQMFGTTNTTNLKMLWDNSALYIGALITDTELNALVTTHDTSGIWNDDSLEFLFDTLNDGGANANDYKIIVNAQGATRDTTNGTDLSWNGPYTKAVSLNGTLNDGANDTSYTIELAIPWTSVNLTPSTAATYGMNFQTNDSDATRSFYTWNGDINIPADAGDVTLSNTTVNVSGDTTAPSTPMLNTPSVVSSSQIDLSWSTATDAESGIQNYKLYYCSGSTSCTPSTVITLGNITSYSHTGLSANTPYRYQVAAVNGAGLEGGKSNTQTATTLSSGGGSPGVDAAVTIRAFPEPVIQGRPTTLSWESHNASSCSASVGWSGTKAVNGSQTLTPGGTSATYAITCIGGSGTPFNDSITVDVITGTQYYIATNGNDANPGTITQPWRTIAKANAALLPGQTVWMRSGTYQEQIRPARSGTAGNPITYAAYPGESVTISTQFSSASYGVNLADRSYIIVDGFQISNTSNIMAYLLRAHHNIFRNNTMTGNYTYAANIFRIQEGSSYNKIQNNTLATVTVGSDCPSSSPEQCIGFFEGIRILKGSHHNLLEKNDIGKALHQALNMTSVDVLNYNNVIRGNTLHNGWHSNLSLWPTSYDLVEHNIIHNAGEDWQQWPWKSSNFQYRAGHSGLQTGGKNGFGPSQGHIFRRNVFQNNGKETFGAGMNQHYFYQNVFYGEYDLTFYDGGDWGSNSIINNVFKNNIFDQNNTNLDFYTPVPIENNYFINNVINDPIWDQPDIVSLASVESAYPAKWNKNIIQQPQFNDPAAGDFTLQQASPLIDKADFLTKTTSTGSGTALPVADARYFTDGFGVIKGDIIQTAGGKTARITAISNNTLTLNRSISWTSGEGVSLPFSGSKPDIGAFEFGQVNGGGGDTQAPSAPTNLSASAVSASQINLAWSPSTDNVGVTGYRVERCQGSSCTNFVQIATPAGTSHSDMGLSPNTTYRYRVRAADAAGNLSGYSSVVTATTQSAPDTQNPTISITSPTSDATYSTQTSTVTLGGTASDNVDVVSIAWDNLTTGASGIGSGTTSWSTPAITLNQGANNLLITAQDAAGNVASDSITVTYTPPDTTAPGEITTLSLGNPTDMSLDLTWTAVGDDGNSGTAVSYTIKRSTTAPTDASTWWSGATTLAGSPTPKAAGQSEMYTALGLASDTTYYFGIRATDDAGNQGPISLASIKSGATLDTTGPTLSNIAHGSITTGSSVITWNTNEPATSVVDYGTTASYGQVSQSATLTTSHSRTLTGLLEDTMYHYRVRSSDAAGNETTSGDRTFTTLDQTAPNAITNLSAASVTENSATLAWSAPGDNGNQGSAASYDIRYSTSPITESNFFSATEAVNTLTPQPAGTTETFTLGGLSDNTTYYVAIKATDESGNTALISNIAVFTTQPIVPPGDTTPPTISNIVHVYDDTTLTARVSWITNEPAESVVMYGFHNQSMDTSVEDSDQVTSHSITLDNLEPKKKYNFQITSTDGAGNSATSQTFSFSTKPGQPSSVQNLQAQQGSVILLWDPISDPDVAAIEVYRSTGGYVSTATLGERITTLTDTRKRQYVDKNTTANTKYYYTVFTKNTEGTYSDPASVSITTRSTGNNAGYVAATAASGVTEVAANGADGNIVIRWTNPTSPEYVRTIVVRKAGDVAPTSPTDGVQVYEGTDAYYLDSNLDNGQRYSYTVFTVDRASNYSRGESATLTPRSGDKSLALAVSAGTVQTTAPAQVSLPSFTHRFTRFLKDRDENNEVRELQRALNHLGFMIAQSGAGSPGNESSYFGGLTRAALQRFQCEHNIVCEGTAASTGFGTLGPKTRAKLNELLAGSAAQAQGTPTAAMQGTTSYTFTRNLKLGSRGEDVKRLQIFLNQEGFTVSETGAGAPGNETDYFGQKTHVALILFQDAHKAAILTPVGLSRGTGFFGPSTISHIHQLMSQQGALSQPPQTATPSTNRAQQIANLQAQIQATLDKVKALQAQLNQ